jgi:PAS domain S-box-containing protein
VTNSVAHDDEVERISRLYSALSRINQAIVRLPTRDELFNRVCQILVEDAGFSMAWIGWDNPATHVIEPVARCRDEHAYVDAVVIHSDDRATGGGPTGLAFSTGTVSVSNDMRLDEAMLPWREAIALNGYRSAAALPIREADQIRGTLNVYSDELGFFQDREVALLKEAAVDISFALDNLAREDARLRAETALRESEERFRATFEQAAVGIGHVALDGRFLRINDRLCEITGFRRDELLQQPYFELAIAEDRGEADQIREDIRGSIESGAPLERRFRHKDGRIYTANIAADLVRDEHGQPQYFVAVVTDITERKRSESALLRSESRYHSLFEHMLEGYAYCEGVFDAGRMVDFSYVEVNSSFGRLTGLHDVVGRRVSEVLPGFLESGRAVMALYERVTRTGVPEQADTYIDALGIWLSLSVYSTDHVHFVSVFDNVTARKESEALLRESEQRLVLATESAGIGIWEWDPATQQITWDRQTYAIYGVDDALMTAAEGWQCGLHAGDVARVSAELAEALAGTREYNTELRIVKPGGEVRDLEAHATVTRDAAGAPVRMVGVNWDITLRKESIRQIKEQAGLLDQARDAIFVRDLDHRISYWSKGAERIFGWTAAEAVGRLADELLHPDLDAFGAARDGVLATGGWAGEIAKLTRDGVPITLESRWTLVHDEQGQPKSILIIDTDITDRKKLEVQFLRAQRMESIGTLAGGIAHDLNNVFAPIIMSLDLLKADCADPQSLELIEIVSTSAQRGAEMVKQVLQFARGLEGRRLAVQLRHLLRDLEKIVRDTFAKNIELRTNVPGDLWTVMGDPTQLHQVLMNLWVNARDAMPVGGVLTLSAENIELDEHYAALDHDAQPGPWLLLQVEDTGTGMSAEVIEKIFDPFFTTKEVGKGTGLGLSTSMAIVKGHGGFIRVYSEVGKGSKIKVYLPAQTEPMADLVAGTTASMPRGNGELILVVDDESAVREITRQTLEAFGYRVLLASDGAEAVAIFAGRKDDIAVVLTDMMMPVMDGPATIMVMRRLQPQVRIIAASGLSANGHVGHASRLGVKHFLPKPYTAQTLLTVLRETLATA